MTEITESALTEKIIQETYATPTERDYVTYPDLIDVDTDDGDLVVRTNNAPALYAPIFQANGFEYIEELAAGSMMERFVFIHQPSGGLVQFAIFEWSPGSKEAEKGIFKPSQDFSLRSQKFKPKAYISGRPIGA